MKNLIINEKQFKMLAEFNLHHEIYMTRLNSTILSEAKDDTINSYIKAGRELKESTNSVGLGYSLLEGALALGIPSQTMVKLAEELGVPPKTKKNMVMGYFQKLDRTDKHLDETLLQEGLFDFLSKFLKGKTGEALKKGIISLVLAGKLAMISTTALAGAAGQIDNSIDVEQFKTELEQVKSQKDGNKIDGAGESLTPEQKQAQLAILQQSKIMSNDGQTHNFTFKGDLNSFNTVNGDNYPQYKTGTSEYNNLQAAFAAAEKGEGVIEGKCSFVKDGKAIVFQGQFVQANGLWYKFTPKSTPVDPVKPVDPIDKQPANTEHKHVGTDGSQFKAHDFSGMAHLAKSAEQLAKLAKQNNPELKKISTEELVRAISNAGSLKVVKVDMSKVDTSVPIASSKSATKSFFN